MAKLFNRKHGLVSVVIPAYNYDKFILDALDGIKNQTYSNIELIVVDDCSTDNTETVVKKWRQRNRNVLRNFIYLKLPRNCGAGWALNIGFCISRGEYIVIHDADDVSHREKIEKQVNLLKEHIDTAMVGTGIWGFDDDINKVYNRSNWLSFNPESIERNYKSAFRHCVAYGTVMFRASILDEVIGCFKAVPVGNDAFFVSNIVNHDFVVENIKDNLFYGRHHEGQMNSLIRKNETAPVLERRKKVEGRASIVLPVKNSSGTILKALEGIESQSYEDMEIIIVDDCSSDNTEDIVNRWYEEYKEKNDSIIKDLIYFRLPQEAGYPWVYNIGCYLSKGEFIAFHHDKGISHMERIEEQVSFFKNNFMYSVVGTNFNGDNSWIKYDDGIVYSYTIDYMPAVNINTIMLRSDVIDKTAGLNGLMQGAEDFEFIYRLLNNGYRVQNLKEILYYE